MHLSALSLPRTSHWPVTEAGDALPVAHRPYTLMWGDSEQVGACACNQLGSQKVISTPHSEQPEGPNKPKDGASRGQSYRNKGAFLTSKKKHPNLLKKEEHWQKKEKKNFVVKYIA